jgi:ABC-2 type transport system permease protein
MSKTKSIRIQHWLEFLLAMTEKEIKNRYKQAWLGFLWLVLNPLLQMFVIGLVFQFFVPVEVENYYLFLLAGLLPWNFFNLSLQRAVPSFVYERNLIKKAKFPRETIVLSIVLSNFVTLLISLLLFICVSLIMGQFSLIQGLWLFPALGWLLILTSGLSLLAASLNVRFRDINFIVQALTALWFYVTPIIYTVDLVPERLNWLLWLNPMTSLINLFRFSLSVGQIKTLNALGVKGYGFGIGLSLIAVFLGIVMFKRKAPTFDDWV